MYAIRSYYDPHHSDWSLWLQSEGLYDFKPHKHQVFDTQDFALTVAANGYGVAMGDLTLIEKDIQTKTLITPFKQTIETGYGYYAIYPSRPANILKVKSFVEWLNHVSSESETNVLNFSAGSAA